METINFQQREAGYCLSSPNGHEKKDDLGDGEGEEAPVRTKQAWFLSLFSSLGKISVLTISTFTPNKKSKFFYLTKKVQTIL